MLLGLMGRWLRAWLRQWRDRDVEYIAPGRFGAWRRGDHGDPQDHTDGRSY